MAPASGAGAAESELAQRLQGPGAVAARGDYRPHSWGSSRGALSPSLRREAVSEFQLLSVWQPTPSYSPNARSRQTPETASVSGRFQAACALPPSYAAPRYSPRTGQGSGRPSFCPMGVRPLLGFCYSGEQQRALFQNSAAKPLPFLTLKPTLRIVASATTCVAIHHVILLATLSLTSYSPRPARSPVRLPLLWPCHSFASRPSPQHTRFCCLLALEHCYLSRRLRPRYLTLYIPF